MEDKIVKTITGQSHIESNCRLIDGKYYLIGINTIENSGDVYLINNRYIRASTDRIVYDHFHKEYKLKNASLVEGIIGTEGDEIILGYFSRNDVYNVRVLLKDGSERLAISKNVLKYAFREKRADGDFYHISLMDAIQFSKLRGVSREIKESLPYDSKNAIDKVSANFEANYSPVICRGASSVGSALKNYTFGIEFETCIGIVPNSKLKHLPLIPLRDGSIGGIEYATVPLKGEKGVQAIIDSTEELKSRTAFGDDCSLHLHIGGMPRTVEFILAFYKLTSYLQNEMFEMFPLYKKYNFGIKRKNYSSPFPFEKINFKMDPCIDVNNKSQLISNFDNIFTYLSGGHSFMEYDNDLKNVMNHPQDPNGNAKWNIKNRYSFVNMIPLIFGNHKTIEFRIHTPTYEVNKIINFLMLNTFLIDYVASNIKNILSGRDVVINRPNLHTLVDEYVSKNVKVDSKSIYSELSNYVSTRRNYSFELARSEGVLYHEDQIKLYSKMNFSSYEFSKNRDYNKKSVADTYASYAESLLKADSDRFRERLRPSGLGSFSIGTDPGLYFGTSGPIKLSSSGHISTKSKPKPLKKSGVGIREQIYDGLGSPYGAEELKSISTIENKEEELKKEKIERSFDDWWIDPTDFGIEKETQEENAKDSLL